MKVSSVVGILAAPALLTAVTYALAPDLSIFWHPTAFAFVVGGAFTVTLVSFRFRRVMTLFQVFFRRIFGTLGHDNRYLIQTIVNLAKARRSGYDQFAQARGRVRDVILRDAASLLDWAQAEINHAQLRDLLETRTNAVYERYASEAEVFRRISSVPIHLGLLGAVVLTIATIHRYQGGVAGVGFAEIGQNALLPLFYGLIMAHVFLKPIADNLAESSEEEKRSRSIVVEGMLLIHSQQTPRYIEEKLKSFLMPNERGKPKDA